MNITDVTNRIFVLNTSNGDVSLTIKTKHGDTEFIRIPRTFIPTEVTAYIPKQDVVDSSDFRKCIQKGLLNLISETDALEILSSEDAKEETSRLSKTVVFGKAENPIKNEEVEANVRPRLKALILDNSETLLSSIKREHHIRNLTASEIKYIDINCKKEDVLTWSKKL